MGIKTGLLDGVLAKYVEIKNVPGEDRTDKITCKVCGFIVHRGQVRSRGTRAGAWGYGNKYWGMKSKMVSHFCKVHPDIWVTLERE